ncbi:calponin homology domain-containing protein [Podospora appendiculata]|uniref:Calponin homology domain-containing protein n=2 Tax=Sordariales TaxID=5139 RepID=A0AAE0X1N4_9PEZI|nr:calponin homology domain-containing protein [Cercophora scortea]KAK3682760.1 calponin homology domain-containing protein [Podospora appendiculata]
MGESRQELVQWLNSLLQLNITKVEQCGTGAALCQVYDSIFLDVPMSRVKFNVNTEYAYIQNFKVLQNTFTKHQIEKSIPIESLVKCKMQDNLDFLQWTKRFWDQYYPGGDYDAVSRRKGGALPPSAGGGSASTRTAASSTGARRPGGGTTPTTTGPRGVGGLKAGGVGGGAASAALQAENTTLKETVVGLERERDFYFSKLRDIELLVQQAVEEDPELEKSEDGLVKQIQTILYSTEEGFEIPEGEQVDDQETF